jgi:Lysozyme inhibitor LprI
MASVTPTLRAVVFAAAALPATAFSQTGVVDPHTLKICSDVDTTPLPGADRPAADEIDSLTGCKSEDLYFGFGAQPDFVKARKCAYLEMDLGQKRQPFGGKTILMMIYANGRGTARNYDVALKLACDVPGSPGDIAGRVRELERYKRSNWTGQGFSVCDHSSDAYMYEQCALLGYRFDHAEREKRLDGVAAKLNLQQKTAFEALRKSAAAFFEVQAAKGQDLSGTVKVHELGFMEGTFISSLEGLEQGELPTLSAADARLAVDAEMNELYGKALARTFSASSALSAEGIRQAQQAWIPFRETWVKFGSLRYPEVSAAVWRAWITRQRIAVLQNSLY